jgi:hypothetical protein
MSASLAIARGQGSTVGVRLRAALGRVISAFHELNAAHGIAAMPEHLLDDAGLRASFPRRSPDALYAFPRA